MGKHRVDLAGIGGEVGLGDCPVTVRAGDISEQLFEIGDVAVHGGAEFGLPLVFALDLVKRRLALQRIEATGEDITFAALVPAPQFHRRIVVDRAGDVDGQRVQRFHHVTRIAGIGSTGRLLIAACAGCGSGGRFLRGAAQKIADPATAFFAACGRRCSRLGRGRRLTVFDLAVLKREGATRGGCGCRLRLSRAWWLCRRGCCRLRTRFDTAFSGRLGRCNGAGDGFGNFHLLGRATDKLGNILQGLDLLGNGAAHRCGAFLGLFRQVERAALQFGTGSIQLAADIVAGAADFVRRAGKTADSFLNCLTQRFLEVGGGGIRFFRGTAEQVVDFRKRGIRHRHAGG